MTIRKALEWADGHCRVRMDDVTARDIKAAAKDVGSTATDTPDHT